MANVIPVARFTSLEAYETFFLPFYTFSFVVVDEAVPESATLHRRSLVSREASMR